MSLKWTQAVWEHSRSRMGARLVLLALADHADESGLCWPSTDRLAAMAGIDARSVRRCINDLIELGELWTDGRRGGNHSTHYRILLNPTPDNMSSLQNQGPRTICPPTPDIMSPDPGQYVRRPRTICPPNRHRTIKEPSARSSETSSDSEPPILTFPTNGKVKEWHLTQSLIETLEDAFPGIDILAEAKKARAWIETNPTNRKTPKGMPRFLNAWISRSSNRGDAVTKSSSPGKLVNFSDLSGPERARRCQ